MLPCVTGEPVKRWNGWGDSASNYPLTEDALTFLRPRLESSSRYDIGAEVRLRHAREQSFPDWIALRSGRPGPVPDAVALPASHDAAADVLAHARQLGAASIPYGGGTSVVGHLAVPATDRPVVSLSLERRGRRSRHAWPARYREVVRTDSRDHGLPAVVIDLVNGQVTYNQFPLRALGRYGLGLSTRRMEELCRTT